MCVTPHIARNDAVTKTGKRRRSAVDGRTTRHRLCRQPACETHRGVRLGLAGLAKTTARLARNAFKFTFTMAAYNLIRMPRLLKAA